MQTEHSPYDTNAREEADATLEEARRLEAINEVEDWRWLMSGPRGRRIVRRLLALTGLYQSGLRSGLDMLPFNEGKRQVGLQLLDQITTICPAEYVQMLQEKTK